MNRMKLGEILSVKHGWAFKGEYFAEDGEQSILTPGNFFEKGGFKPNNGKERYYTGTYPKEYLCHKGDLIVAMTQQAEGLLGSTALVPENNKYLHNQRIGLITCDEKRLNKLFAYYLFMTKSVREQLERMDMLLPCHKSISLSKLHQKFLQIGKNTFLKVTLCKICILRKA